MIYKIHKCKVRSERSNMDDLVYYGSTFDSPEYTDPIEWHLDLGMEWTHVNFCPWCGKKLSKPRKFDPPMHNYQ